MRAATKTWSGTLLASLFVSLLPALFHGNALADSITLTDTLTVAATSKGTAEKGSYERGGDTLITTDAQLALRQKHAAQYDGKTEFTVNYTIVLDDQGTLDRTKSTVTFITLTYTDQGTLVTDATRFTTLPIPIYEVSLDKDKSVSSFKFESPNWYPEELARGLIKNVNLYGSIDLTGPGETWYKAQYSSVSSGAIYTYEVTGNVLYKPAQNPDVAEPCANVPGCVSFLAPTAEIETPEPSTWVLMLTGLSCLGAVAHRRATDRRHGSMRK